MQGQGKSTGVWCGQERSDNTAPSIFLARARGQGPQARPAAAFGSTEPQGTNKETGKGSVILRSAKATVILRSAKATVILRSAKATVTRMGGKHAALGDYAAKRLARLGRDGVGAIGAGRSGQGGSVRRPLAGQSIGRGRELLSSGFAKDTEN